MDVLSLIIGIIAILIAIAAIVLTSTGNGATGKTGSSGSMGVQGPQGPSSPDNIYQGPQGPQGFQGQLGLQGDDSIQGPQGFQGPQGSDIYGPQGPQGPQGIKGDPGTIMGDQGPMIAQGLRQGIFRVAQMSPNTDEIVVPPAGNAWNNMYYYFTNTSVSEYIEVIMLTNSVKPSVGDIFIIDVSAMPEGTTLTVNGDGFYHYYPYLNNSTHDVGVFRIGNGVSKNNRTGNIITFIYLGDKVEIFSGHTMENVWFVSITNPTIDD